MRIVNNNQYEYEGTDPVKDAKIIYKTNVLTKLYKEKVETTIKDMSLQKSGLFNDFGHGVNAYFLLI